MQDGVRRQTGPLANASFLIAQFFLALKADIPLVALLKCLRYHPHAPGMDIGHAAFNLRLEIAATQMDVLQCSVGAAMTGKERDLVDVPATSRKVC
jgi:hypothetical protein